MAYENPVQVLSFKAGADLSAKQYYLMKMSANDTVTVCAAATDVPIGILQNKPDAAGKTAEVMVFGVSKASADGTLAAGDLYGTSSDGQADKKIVSTDSTEYVVGMVISGAAADELATVTVGYAPFRAA